jgi:hypothetical protein
MKYTHQQLGFILYNNRSVEGVVKNFINKNIDANKLIDIEKKFDWSKSLYNHLENFVEVDLKLINSQADDINITPEQLYQLTDFTKLNCGKFSPHELLFLHGRGITNEIIQKYNILGLSNFTNIEHLKIIGATCHPILQGFLQDGISEGGIVIPLFESSKLTNCAIRRITDVGKLKYTLAVPDIPVWGLKENCEEVWICEGLFDMMTLQELGLNAISPSSAMWSGIQLYKLLETKPKKVNIFCDNDRVGLKTGLILHKFFNIIGVESATYRSTICKDPAEHFLEKKLNFDQIEQIKITKEMIEKNVDNSFDFLKYLQKRKF